MFYSESLLAKTGPLARVWLAANLEKKLTKQSILQSDIDNNVKDIIGTGQAPLALRLSGQLLLGVVRIYNRKAKYLFDDCSEALGRLKMAFRAGNVDLPAHQLLNNNPTAMTLPDRITEQDLFAPLPDPDDWMHTGLDINLQGGDMLDFGTSQFLPETQLTPSSQRSRPRAGLEDDDLGLFDDEPSIEIGRRAATPRDNGPSLLEDDLGLDLGFGDTTFGENSAFPNDTEMRDADDVNKAKDVAHSNASALIHANEQRVNSSPVADHSFRIGSTAIEEIDETAVQAAQRVKRRKVLQQDFKTQIETDEIKRMQADRSSITRPANLLPQDPVLLQLMEMQRSGAFVSNILRDGRMTGMAPELRGILSIEVVRKIGERKRKRDSGIADMERSSDRVASSPRIDLPDENVHDFNGDTTLPEGLNAQAGDEEFQVQLRDDAEGDMTNHGPDFDVTEAPLLHPSQSGPVSLGTKTAVAALRKHLAPGHRGTEPPTPSKRTRAEARFTELCPVKSTNRADATKMFFELLVLGTKDAVKIEQEKDSGFSGEIRVRGKRGLWGPWAEVEEIEDAASVAAA